MAEQWDKTAAAVKFSREIMQAEYTIPVFQATDSPGNPHRRSARQCVKCGEIFPLEACSNCGNDGFVPGYTEDRVLGVFCLECDTGFSRWTCPECDTDNPIRNSMVMAKSGCFVATAVFGNESTPEVHILRAFRDEFLMTSRVGQRLVSLYYKFSPGLAKFIEPNQFCRASLRIFVFKPLVPLIGLLLKIKSNSDYRTT